MLGRSTEEQKLKRLLRRVIDHSTPQESKQVVEQERRETTRYRRALPVLLVPLVEDEPLIDEAEYVISRDLSDTNISVLHVGHFPYEKVVIGILVADAQEEDATTAVFATGCVRDQRSVGGDHQQIAIEFETQYRHPAFGEGLKILAQGLLPLHLRLDDASPEAIQPIVNSPQPHSS